MSRPRAIVPVASDQNFARLLVYGEPGVGKTVMAASGEGKTLMLINDHDETSSAAAHGSKADRWVLNDFSDLEEAYQYLRHEGCQDYDWVWFDNVTLFQEQGMDQVMRELVEAKPNRNRWVPDMHEYLVVQNQLGTYIRDLKALPVHFGMTAHVMKAEDISDRLMYQPMFQGGQGAFSQKICGYMGAVGYMTVRHNKDGSDTRRIIWSKRARFYAKSRYEGLQGEMTDPTLSKVEAAIKSKLPSYGQLPQLRTANAKKAKVATSKTKATRRRAS